MDRLTRGEAKRFGADFYRLLALTHEANIHAMGRRIVERQMAELLEIEVAAQFAVDAAQQVQIEFGGHPLGIVVGRLDRGNILLQIDADEHAACWPNSVRQAN